LDGPNDRILTDGIFCTGKMPFQQTGYQKELCVQNSTTESIQTFNVKAKFQVKTFTALNKLEVADDCDCDA